MVLAVSSSICDIKRCNQECVKSCPQNEKGIKTLYIQNGKAVINIKHCIECLLCLKTCPLEAINVMEKRTQKDKNERKKKEKKERENVFEIDDDVYRQMSERNTIFARVLWDKDFQGYQKGIFEGAKNKIPLGLDGYSEIEHAAISGAWAIDGIIGMFEREQLMKMCKKEDIEDSRGVEKKKRDPLNPEGGEGQKRVLEDKPKELTNWVKKIAMFYGADLVGIAPINIKWIYTEDRRGEKLNLPEGLTNAIVFAVEMDIDAINTAPKYPSGIATGLGYSKMAFVRTLLTAFIKKLGYQAIPAGNNIALSVPLAIEAGLGGYGRHGLLITKEFGPRVRIAKILTDMPLIP
ncbi:MAG: 4Fe-4S dicluster domain-containing protein, partial [Candidatus Heimdallarchaeaceae archaeon]